MLHGTNPYTPGSDEFFMRRALELAQGGMGWTSPNPLVGCVLARDGQVIAEGWHQRDGQEHAEALALRACDDASGATAYVNLEPCAHVGRQPACCTALAEAGVSRVVYGSEDANPITRGMAARLLPERGIAVKSGVLKTECDRFLDYYLHSHDTEKAFIHIKLALSLDGKAACSTGHSQWLSGQESLGLAHYLRQLYDGVLISARTALADQARLSVRLEQMQHFFTLPTTAPPRQPVRIVVDPQFEIADKLNRLPLADPAGNWREHLPQLVLVGRNDYLPQAAPDANGMRLELIGLETPKSQSLDWQNLAIALRKIGIISVLVEGGPRLVAELLHQEAADRLTLVQTPRLIGGDGLGFTPTWGYTTVGECPLLSGLLSYKLGDDCIVSGYPVWC